MDWDDIRVFLAVSRAGSLSGAARTLGVNHSTVFRRINGLEDRLGVRLFERHRDGYVPTAAGDEMRRSAERIAAEVDVLDRRVTGRDLQLRGPVVVTTTDTLAHRYLGPHFAAFHAAYPEVRLDVVLDTEFLNLSKRQADVAIRPTLAPPETLVGQRVAGIAFEIYAAPGYLALHGETGNLGDHAWLGFDEGLAHVEAAKWLRGAVPDDRVVFRANNLFALYGAALGGLGLAVLPCFLGDPEPGLERVPGLPAEVRSELWLLTHADLRRTARIRAVLDFMSDALRGDAGLLEGRGLED
ncbi:MAG: LysR family transcriptional regulator [Magnetovibrio sp.]|nr:LysR family transcriptional regulator [Magnetovibrio sp.]